MKCLKNISEFRTIFLDMFCRQLINEIMQDNLEKYGYQKEFESDDTQQIILPGTTPEFLPCKEKRRLQWRAGTTTQNNVWKRKSFIIAYLYTFIREETFSIMMIQHNSEQLHQWLAALQSHQRGDLPCPKYTTSGQNKSKQAECNNAAILLLTW